MMIADRSPSPSLSARVIAQPNLAGGLMNRDEVLKVLRAHKAILARRFGVANLALFGSVARNDDV